MMNTHGVPTARKMELLREVHEGAWRTEAPAVSLSLLELAAIIPRLMKLGSAGLVWTRLADKRAAYGVLARTLEQGHALQSLHNELVPKEIARAVSRLREVEIEPVLVKGWAISRLYPPPLVRPAGDIDLWVPHADLERAHDVLFDVGAERSRVGIDLQYQLPHVATKWVSVSQSELARSTELVEIGGVNVRVPRLDDHLRMLCFHFLGHGALRPLWLCDIALLLESRGARFDWERLLGTDRRLRERVTVSLLLAHELLGARIDDTPLAGRGGTLPRWLTAAVLNQWEHGEQDPTERSTPDTGALHQLTQDPKEILAIFQQRFPDPIRATVWRNAPFNDFPRWPLQWSSFIIRMSQYTTWRMVEQVRLSARGRSPVKR